MKRRKGSQEETTHPIVVGQELPPCFPRLPRCHRGFLRTHDKLATKVVVSVIFTESNEPDVLNRWFSQGDLDVRYDLAIGEQILAFLKPYAPRSTVVTDRIIGCPLEEGTDYPEGASCPQCPYWAGRDRFTHERIQ